MGPSCKISYISRWQSKSCKERPSANSLKGNQKKKKKKASRAQLIDEQNQEYVIHAAVLFVLFFCVDFAYSLLN